MFIWRTYTKTRYCYGGVDMVKMSSDTTEFEIDTHMKEE